MRWVVLGCAVVALGGCVGGSTKTAWSHYAACDTGGSFGQMVECGKRRRQAECAASNSCSERGDIYVTYADALAAKVRAKEISEADARLKLAEMNMKMQSDKQAIEMQAAAIIASSGPVTCNRFGSTTTCY